MKARAACGCAALCVLVAMAAVTSGCAGRKKTADVSLLLPPGDLYRSATELIARGKLRQARELLQRIQFSSDSRDLEPLAKLAIADTTFYEGHDLSLIDARTLYLDFVTLYGTHPLAPYAQLQAGLCSLRQVEQPSRDQTQTTQAVDDLVEVMRRFPGAQYEVAARKLLSKAQANLADHEFLVGRFYLERKAYLAATERFRRLLDAYPDFAEKEKVYFHLARALLANDNDAEARIYFDKLVTDYPHGEYAEQARRALDAAGGSLHGDAPQAPLN